MKFYSIRGFTKKIIQHMSHVDYTPGFIYVHEISEETFEITLSNNSNNTNFRFYYRGNKMSLLFSIDIFQVSYIFS